MGNGNIVNETVTTSTVRVNGAELYHEIRGNGPPLLFIMGMTGDGGAFQQVAEQLSDEFTVVTYHRRGNSLSPRPDGWTSTTIDEQADDAAGLLGALGLAPAVVFGNSASAVILLNMMLRHPETLRGAFIHEPPLLPVLANGAKIGAEFQAMVEHGLATTGPRGTMEGLFRLFFGDANDENLDSELRQRMLGNAEVFFHTELPATMQYVPDADALSACTVPALVAAGIDNRGHWFHDSSAWAATQLGTPLQELSGAHTPYFDHPDALAEAIRSFALSID